MLPSSLSDIREFQIIPLRYPSFSTKHLLLRGDRAEEVSTERCSWWSDETVVACSRFAYLNFGISAFFGNRRNSPSENCRHPVARVGPNVAIFFGHQLSEWIDQPLRDWPRPDIWVESSVVILAVPAGPVWTDSREACGL
jgi:hypothetical protein